MIYSNLFLYFRMARRYLMYSSISPSHEPILNRYIHTSTQMIRGQSPSGIALTSRRYGTTTATPLPSIAAPSARKYVHGFDLDAFRDCPGWARGHGYTPDTLAEDTTRFDDSQSLVDGSQSQPATGDATNE